MGFFLFSLYFWILMFFRKKKAFFLVVLLLIVLIKISFLYNALLNSWLSFLLVLVYIRGLLVLYFYFCTLIKNFESLSLKFLFFLFFFLFFRKRIYSPFLFEGFKLQIYRFFKQGLLIFLILLLLISLWIIGKLLNRGCFSFRPCF